MAIIKCKMCGGDLLLVEGSTIATCEYCGSTQTVPSADSEKMLNLFASANKLRAACEFDRAAGIYDAIKAEFPSEAEAYWGLVLCKYGIEYVDDPATGRKIPTCHRLSYDNVMDDANLELAMDYADAAARKVYREEAKLLEKIRTGILEVSSKEKPYDIFICYKETDPNGDRTLDSVLAQDIYMALTDKGYRVFFSRITLQSKLGEAYEPFIFAALNSAKVMLAIGTDPEYYNAVWVKNEWSRYLKISAADKTKHLIPCYKDMDAYDMPKEFRPLQGVDLGKMGAVQDILFNMEKYIPLKKQTTTVIQEKVVVGGSGNNKIASLLDRGNMALEDGDWAKADSFFEDVLNNDSKNAQAYLGKTLSMERCRTIDALVRKRKDAHQNVTSERQCIEPRTAHINEMAERCSLPGYVDAGTIRNLYEFDLGYPSDVPGRQQQYREEEAWWQNHKQLSRAEKFAAGAVAENLVREKQALFAALNERVKKAQAAETAAKQELMARYDAHIQQADDKAEKLYNDGLARREQNYQNWLAQAKTETNPSDLKTLAGCFDGLRDYQDSKNLAEHCRKRAADEQAKIDAENEQKRIAQAKAAAARKKKNTVIGIVATLMAVVMMAAILVVTKIVIPGNNYKAAVALAEAEQYEEAAAAFEALGNYKDAQEQANAMRECILAAERRAEEERLAAEKKAEEERLAAERKAEEERLAKEYAVAVEFLKNDNKIKALMVFVELGTYKDSQEQAAMLRSEITQRDAIGAGAYYTVGRKEDGSIVTVGSNGSGQSNVSSWSDIIAISTGYYHTVGLKEDGTVVAVGDNLYTQCDVSHWKDIIAIGAGSGHTVGLKADGSVVAAGDNYNGQCNVTEWKDIIAVNVYNRSTVGLKVDGTVVAVGDNYYDQLDVSHWKDIVAISAGGYHTVGLKADGTVVAVGSNTYGQCDVTNWTDIVAISAGDHHTVGLKADGTIVAVGKNDDGRCDVSRWKNVVAISAGSFHTVGLKADGTLVATGSNSKGQCNVSGWRDIKLPQ